MSKALFYKILNYILGSYKTTITQQVNTYERFYEKYTDVGTDIWEGDHLFISYKGIVKNNRASGVELKINLPTHTLTINARTDEALKLIEELLINLK